MYRTRATETLTANESQSQNISHNVDGFFLQLTFALIVVGIFAIASASWYESIHYTGSPWTFLLKHFISVALGIVVMLVVSYIHYQWWYRSAWLFVTVCLILLLLTSTQQFGIVTGGSRRWLSLGFFQLQISEFVKIAAVVLMAKVFYERNTKSLFISAGIVSLMGFMVLRQPDLGTTILVMSSLLFVAYAGGFNLILFFAGLGGFSWLVWQQILKTPYQMERIKFWLDPYSEPLGRGYNLIQSQYAIGSGGLFGLGWGASQQKLGYLPVAHADFIFSIICEEVGLLGAAAILLLFIAWIFRAVAISLNVDNIFARCLGFGLTGILALQVMINISVAIGLLPTTGMTLPFISFGGSSFISCAIIAGIILNLSRYRRV